ncbi:MAG: TolC family protein [Planctomycetaceae bacterium]|nr:TolC family protein [Planctomycetales bacterium]MCB9920934.1 TolC family protein [Planctomycetaceae bacterium]
MLTREIRATLIASLGLFLLCAGCRAPHAIRDPEYYELDYAVSQAWNDPNPVEAAVSPSYAELAGPHPVEDYIQFSLAQNPQIQAARLRLESAANRVPQAASLQDPMFGVTAYAAPVQTAAGQQEVSVTASQKLPWFGKLATQADVAEQEVQAARAQLAAAELEVVEKVKRGYYQLYFVEQAIRITEENKKQLQLIETIVDRRYRVERKVNQQDVLRVQVEVARLDTELVQLRQQLDSAQARLARQLHLSPETPVRTLEALPMAQIPRDIEGLYRRAIASRPELHAALATIERDRRASDLARLNYFPDVTLGMTWIDTSSAGISPIANGNDSFLLGATVNLPIYKTRLEAGVREAETRAVASARQYDSLKDATMEDVKDLFAQATSQEELLQLFREDIIPKAEQTLDQSIGAYPVGEVDILQLVDNWRQLLRFYINEKQLEAQLRQSLASLARVVGSYEVNNPPGLERLPVPPIAPPNN